MQGLEDLEIGLMFWARLDATETLRRVKSFGLRAGQLGFPGDLPLEGAADRWDEALTAEHFTAVAAVCSYVGEEYADIPAVQTTVGLVPPKTRAERVARTKAVSDVARNLGLESVACHIGFVPEDPQEALYAEIRDVARDLCDHCGKNGRHWRAASIHGHHRQWLATRRVYDAGDRVRRPGAEVLGRASRGGIPVRGLQHQGVDASGA